jgi:hypothetical protein
MDDGMSLLYRAAVFANDVVNRVWPLQVPEQHAAAEREALQEVWSPAATIRDVCDRLDDIRNQLHQLSACPRSDSAGSDGADPPPAPVVGRGGGHPTSPDNRPSPGWSGEGPGGGDPTAPPGQPDRPLSELLRDAANWIKYIVDNPGNGTLLMYGPMTYSLLNELRDTAAQFEALELSDP